MRLRVLSADGSVGPGSEPSCFLIGEHLLLDAGSAASKLDLEEQLAIRSVLLTHSHLDHVMDLPFLCENAFGRRRDTLEVMGAPETVERLARHLFNGEIWPDFTTLPRERPLLRWRGIPVAEWFEVEGLQVFAIHMEHPGGSLGFLLDSGEGMLGLSGDTGPGSGFWARLDAHASRLRGVLVECSFPDRLEALARESGHLCPRLLREELREFGRPSVPVHVYGLKGPTREETRAEIAAWSDERELRIVETDDSLSF